MNLLEFYNFYSNTLEDRSYSASLLGFYDEVMKDRIQKLHQEGTLKVLDMGVGFKSLFEDVDLDYLEVLAVDNVSIAILKAQRASIHTNIRYELQDMSEGRLDASEFDIILDSHMLHCVIDESARERVFKNIYHTLKEGGLFFAEMMVEPRDNTKLKNKYVPKSIELEAELIGHGFKIKYFMIVEGSSFVDAEGACDLCRVVCTK